MYIDYRKYVKRKKSVRTQRNKKRKLRKSMKRLDTYFRKDAKTYQNKGIIVFDFDDTKSNEFIQNYIIPFRQSYVSDEDLDYEVDNGINTRKDAIENKLPTSPQLKSGEFSEILMFFLACKFICPDANITPIKWHWKEHRDAPCHLTDIMLLKCADKDNPHATDYVCSIEVKSSATPIGPRSNASRMNEAIEGAIKDKNSRIGKMIAYLTTKYAKDRKADMAKLVKRFDDGTTVHYDRHISAAIIVERNSMQYHIKNITAANLVKAQTEQIALFAVPLRELKQMYENLYSITPTKG